MVMDWFGRSKRASVADLIARRNYKKAIDAIKAELQKRRKDRRLRLQLAEVLVMADRKKEAIEILNTLADDLVLAGFAAQAIAILKKVQAIEPGRTDVEEKLVYLISQQSAPAEDPWLVAKRRRELEAASARTPELGMEEIGDEPGLELGTEAAEEPAADAAQPAPGEGAALFSDDAVRDELVALMEDVFRPSADAPAAVATERDPTAAPALDLVETPLFKGLAPEELAAFVHGLRLLRFDAGEIVITEGEPRGSLFVITSGRVRAYVRNNSGRSLPIRDLGEGDFFGEISVLTGSPRTATITAATRCELLELDRPSLDSICRSHPRVRQVLQEFYEQRSGNTIEAAIREMQGSGPA